MRIAVVVPDDRPNPLYRALFPMEELSRRGHVVGTAVVPSEQQLPPVESFLAFDVVYIWRMYYAPLRRLARTLRERGVAVIWDNDDDIRTVPRGAANYRDVGGMKAQRAWSETQSMIRSVDAVTTPSPLLAEHFRRAGQAHVEVIENYLPAVGKARKPTRGRVTIGWVAAGEHTVDVKPLGLRASLLGLLEQRPELHVETIGVALDLDHPRYHRTTIIPLADLAAQTSRFDIGIAPLADSPFNRSRSNVKLKEYAAVGVPWLASPVGPYADLGEDEGGRLVADGDWEQAMLSLVDDPDARRVLAERAHAWARRQTLSEHAGRWEQVLQGAVERARARSRAA